MWLQFPVTGLDTGRGLLFGYHSNEVGFGWTNAVFTAIYDELEPRLQQELLLAG